MTSRSAIKGQKCQKPSHPPQQILKEEKDATKSVNALIEVGAEFENFDSLDQAIKAYEAENFVNLIARDTRRIEAAGRRNRRKNYNPVIKYSDVCYCCTYGGKKFISRSMGKRMHKTIKQACPFVVKVRATPDGQRLFIREMSAVHNHEISEVEFRLHPKQRKLDHVSQEEIATLLSLEPDKKLLREKLMQVTGKVILMKDIHNIKTRLVGPKDGEQLGAVDDVNMSANVEKNGVDLVENLRVVSEPMTQDLPDGKQDLISNSLSIHIPVSQIGATELTNVLTTMVNTGTEGLAGSDQRTQSHSQADVSDPSQVINSEFTHPSAIFRCSLDSFSQQSHESYQVSSQPLLSDVNTVITSSPTPICLNTIQEHSGSDARNQTFNSLDEDHNMGINILHSLQPWQGIDSNSTQRTAFQSHLHQNSSVLSTHNPTPSDTVSKNASSINYSIVSFRGEESSNFSHLQHQNQHQKQQEQSHNPEGTKGPRLPSSLQRRKTQHNPIESDKEAIKKKYFQQASVNLFFNERFSYHGNKHPAIKFYSSGSGKSSDKMSSTNFHEMLKPLSWLFGSWTGCGGKGIYPTIDDFCYSEVAEFCPVAMKPMVEYKFYSSKPDGSTPLHRETGFIRIKPNTNHIAFVAAHNLGIAEVQEGEVKDNELSVETTELSRVSFNKPPIVKKVRRTLKRAGDELEHVMYMQTDKTEMTEHLRITFKKVDS